MCIRDRYATSVGSPVGLTGMLSAMSVLRGRYRILHKRAQGGMAAVYEALDLHLAGKRWAIKEMSDAIITSPLERQRAITAFQQEAQMLATLDHPNLPKVVDYFSEGGREYLVMEYVDGQTLDEMLSACGNRPFSEDHVLDWALQLCAVLDYLHHQNIIFRDLKPSNIMVEQSGMVRLIDFGIARLFKPGKASDTAAIGTLGYAPPEQYGSIQTDLRSDVYSLGATLHTLLTGFDPSQSPLLFPPVRHLNPAVSVEMERVITTAMAQKPEQRWQNIAQMRNALMTSPSGKLIASAQATPAKPRSQPITTRLLAAMSTMTTQQLAIMVGGLVALFAIATALFGPFIQRELPIVWRTAPLYFAAGIGAWAASHRKGAAGVTQALVATIVMVISSGSEFELNYIIGALAGAAVMEGSIALGKYRRWDALWLIGAAVAAWIAQSLVTYGFNISPDRFVALVGAALAGALGWFLGDLFWQGRQMRQGQIP